MHMLQKTLITFPVLKLDTNSSKTFFPSTIIKWSNLDFTLRNSKSFADFKSILKFIRFSPSSACDCINDNGIRLITQLRVGMSQFCEHKFKYSLQSLFKSSLQLWFRYWIYLTFSSPLLYINDERYTLLSTLNKIDYKLLELTKPSLLQTLLYGNTLFD